MLTFLIGLVLVCYSDLKLEDGIPMGSLWTLAGAFFYSSYIVFLRRKIDHEDKLDVPMFFGFVGLFSFMLLWPLFPILHFTNHERFELPNRPQIIAMLVNGIIGTGIVITDVKSVFLIIFFTFLRHTSILESDFLKVLWKPVLTFSLE